MSSQVDAEFLRDWANTATEALASAREDIDALNVFPVPDGDTGTNMYLTMVAAREAMAADLVAEESDASDSPQLVSSAASALARGALMGARGNSGVILSQIVRGLVRISPQETASAVMNPADTFRRGMTQAAELAYAAVAEPQEGTMLTVMRCAAEAAAEAGGDLADVLRAAVEGGEEALARTPEMLEPLRRAGVVDSGGYGIVVVLSALLEVVTGVRRPPPDADVPAVAVTGDSHTGYSGPAYEVMFLLEADDEDIPGLKSALAELGDSLVVVGGDRLWNIHVHVHDAGAAVEAGMAAGRPYRIKITWLFDTPGTGHVQVRQRSIVAVAHGPGLGQLLAEMEVAVVTAEPGEAPATGELLQAALSSDAGEIVLLPSDKNVTSSAESAAHAARKDGLRVAVVPTRSVVQTLAAVAVHDPEADFDDDVVAMSRAAAATRYGAVTISTKEAITTAGPCKPGDVLGIVDGDILQIGEDVESVAGQTLDLMLSSGGELVTIVSGADLAGEVVDRLNGNLAINHPGADVTVYEGGQPIWPLIFGVE
ncbi:MAG: DAK2 domain-containing protein [Actinomycetia bacterium]|nr:DAK2 domain-containing protein [Actinomycetes bacterium]MCH9799907.1 DAK2 domain-containing protein [Actinomycetes bacterium]